MERRKAANNEIFDILLKSALITRYENEVSAAMLSADEHTYPAEFHRRLRQIKNTAAEYFRQNPVWKKVFEGFQKKYASYDSFSGTVVLRGLKQTEIEELEGFFGRS